MTCSANQSPAFRTRASLHLHRTHQYCRHVPVDICTSDLEKGSRQIQSLYFLLPSTERDSGIFACKEKEIFQVDTCDVTTTANTSINRRIGKRVFPFGTCHYTYVIIIIIIIIIINIIIIPVLILLFLFPLLLPLLLLLIIITIVVVVIAINHVSTLCLERLCR